MAIHGISRVAPIGKVFGDVTVISNPIQRTKPGSPKVMGRCKCGDERIYFTTNLTKQDHPKCPNCRLSDRPSKGGYGHPLFNIWKAMIQRCENPNHTWYHRYGGRGISICVEWRQNFYAFARDMGERPSLKHTIDRIDGDKGYSPDNCRWATPKEQQNNKCNTPFIDWGGKEIALTEAAKLSVVDYATLAWRLSNGWGVEDAMTIPSKNSKNRGRRKRIRVSKT